jgi:hypothetical protein
LESSAMEIEISPPDTDEGLLTDLRVQVHGMIR